MPKKYSSPFLFLILLSMSLGCTRSLPSDPYTIVIGVETYPQELDPRLSVDALSSKINHLIYNGLFKLNQNLEVVPDLASEVIYESPTVLKITLKDNVYFHNGEKLTSLDVLATFNSIRDPALQSPRRSLFENIEKIEVVDPLNLRLTLKKQFSPLLTSLNLGILPATIAKGKFKPIGTGPYQFESAQQREKIVLKRFDNFFGTKPKNNKLIFRTIYDDTLRTLELIQGRLDLVQNAIPYVLLPAIKEKKNLKFESAPGINFTYMGFNLNDPILKEVSVRKAISLAINRHELIQYKLKNLASSATSLLFPGHWAFNRKLKNIDYNTEEAKHLLDSAGFSDPDGDGPKPRFKLIYKTATKKDRIEKALIIANYLKKIGIEVEVKPYEWATFFRDIRTGNFQIFTLTWVGVTEPDIYYYAFHSTQIPPNGANRGFYTNLEFDKLVEKGREEQDMEKRKEIYGAVQEIILNNLVYVPLWYEHNWVVYQANIHGHSLRSDAGFQNLVETYKDDLLFK